MDRRTYLGGIGGAATAGAYTGCTGGGTDEGNGDEELDGEENDVSEENDGDDETDGDDSDAGEDVGDNGPENGEPDDDGGGSYDIFGPELIATRSM